jgi:hypothetical protein
MSAMAAVTVPAAVLGAQAPAPPAGALATVVGAGLAAPGEVAVPPEQAVRESIAIELTRTSRPLDIISSIAHRDRWHSAQMTTSRPRGRFS